MENVYILNNNEKKIINSLSYHFSVSSPCEDLEIYMHQSKLLSEYLPDNLKEKIRDLKNENLKDDILLIRNFPVDKDIKTPENNTYFYGEHTHLSKCQAIINEFIGEMVSYEAEASGRLFQDMVPNKKLINTQTSLGSKTELELHTEQAFSELRPDYLCLSCLKGDKSAKTYYLHKDQITENLTEEEIELCRKKLWNIGVDLSFIMNGCHSDTRGPVSILQNDELVFDQDLMDGINDKAKQIINKIIDIYYKHRKYVVLEPGDMLLINNKKLVHGRSSFNPKFDGNDRFIIRSFIMNKIEKILNKTVNNNRMVSTKFS